MENNEKLNVYLNAIYQNTKTAIQSIEDILPKCEDEELKSELAREEDGYNVISKECEAFAKAEAEIDTMYADGQGKITPSAELLLKDGE